MSKVVTQRRTSFRKIVTAGGSAASFIFASKSGPSYHPSPVTDTIHRAFVLIGTRTRIASSGSVSEANAKAAAPSERKLTSVMVADVVGYSRLTAADEEGTIARLRELRSELVDPAVARHRGRIVKTMGDGFLIEFPSALDAVRSSLEIQQGLGGRKIADDAAISLRVGIHISDVLVEPDGDLLGDGVNIAARLAGNCGPRHRLLVRRRLSSSAQ